MPIVILTYVIQLAFVVHVFKTGRNTYWVYLLLVFPGIGGLAYVIVELLPDWLSSRSGQKVSKKIKQAIDPDKDLKAAYQKVEIAGTVSNISNLAEQLALKGRYQEAKDLYESCLTGLNKNDPKIMLGLATTYFGLSEFTNTISTLDALIANNPKFKSPEGHLLYAQAHEQSGNLDKAIQEYEALIKYYPGPEPTCRYAQLLTNKGDNQQAMDLWHKVVSYSKHAGKHYNEANKEWITLAKREGKG